MRELVQRLADHLEDRMGAPQSLHCNDEIIMIDADDLRGLPAFRKRRVLARAKQETVRRLLIARIGEEADAGAVSHEIDSVVEAAEHTRALRARRGFVHFDCFEADVRGHCHRIRDEIWGKPALATQTKPLVYFVTGALDGEVKIGFTTQIADRLRALRTACSRDPGVLLTIEAGPELERQLHDRFADDWIRREWYRISPEITAFIAAEKAKQASN